jgi:hypothetical protein
MRSQEGGISGSSPHLRMWGNVAFVPEFPSKRLKKTRYYRRGPQWASAEGIGDRDTQNHPLFELG